MQSHSEVLGIRTQRMNLGGTAQPIMPTMCQVLLAPGVQCRPDSLTIPEVSASAIW